MALCKLTEKFDFEVVEAKPTIVVTDVSEATQVVVEESVNSVASVVDRIHDMAKHLEMQVANLQYGHSESIDDLADHLAQISRMLHSVKHESSSAGANVQGLYQVIRNLNQKVSTRMGTDDRRVRTLEHSIETLKSELRENYQASKGVMLLIEAERSARRESTDSLTPDFEQATLDQAGRFDRLLLNYLPALEMKIQAISKSQEHVAPRVERLCGGQDDIWHDAKQLTKRVKWVEDVASHVSDNVVPSLEARIQEQQELLQIKDAEIASTWASAKKTATRNADMARRMAALEATIQRLAGEAESSQQTSGQRKTDFAAELLCELTERARRKHRQNTERLSPEAFRGEILRRALTSEIRRREHRRTLRALRAEFIRRDLRAEVFRRRTNSLREVTPKVTLESLNAEIRRRACKQLSASVCPSEKHLDIIKILCKTLMDEVSVSVEIPKTVAVRYLKQLIYFKTGGDMHATSQTLVYAGKVLQDNWKIGGGMFTRPASDTEEEFAGIRDGATVLMVIKKD